MANDAHSGAFAFPRLIPWIGLGGLLLVIGGGTWLGLSIALLTAAGLVLALVITLVWQSLQHLSGDTDLSFEEALSLAAPTAAEEQKRAVLRALKDLEYERSVGKISEEDYLDLSARYRNEAKQLILVVDDTLAERRRRAEALLERHLRERAKAEGKAQRKKQVLSPQAEEMETDPQLPEADRHELEEGLESGTQSADKPRDPPNETSPAEKRP